MPVSKTEDHRRNINGIMSYNLIFIDFFVESNDNCDNICSKINFAAAGTVRKIQMIREETAKCPRNLR